MVLTVLLATGQLAHCLAAGAPPPAIASPVIPDRTFNITHFGAVGDGKTLNTAAIKKAVAACSAAGGGTVVVPPGQFLTAPFSLASNLNLNLQSGATILISGDRKYFKLAGDKYDPCITASKCHDIAITGSGVIDGQGDAWWKEFLAEGAAMPDRPYLIRLDHCQRVLVRGITLTNSPMFHLVPKLCQDVTIDGVTIQAPIRGKNTDGIDPSGFNFLITRCTIDTGDDNIAIKPTGRIDPNRPALENMLITNCTFRSGHGMSIGGQTNGGVRNLTVRDCTFDGTDAGIRMKAPRGKGGLVENLTYENLTMKNVKYPISISSYYPEGEIPKNLTKATKEPVLQDTPVWRHIRITNLTAAGGEYAGRIIGLPEMHVTDIVLTNVNITAKKKFTIASADVQFVNSKITPEELTVVDAKVEGLDPDAAK